MSHKPTWAGRNLRVTIKSDWLIDWLWQESTAGIRTRAGIGSEGLGTRLCLYLYSSTWHAWWMLLWSGADLGFRLISCELPIHLSTFLPSATTQICTSSGVLSRCPQMTFKSYFNGDLAFQGLLLLLVLLLPLSPALCTSSPVTVRVEEAPLEQEAHVRWPGTIHGLQSQLMHRWREEMTKCHG